MTFTGGRPAGRACAVDCALIPTTVVAAGWGVRPGSSPSRSSVLSVSPIPSRSKTASTSGGAVSRRARPEQQTPTQPQSSGRSGHQAVRIAECPEMKSAEPGPIWVTILFPTEVLVGRQHVRRAGGGGLGMRSLRLHRVRVDHLYLAVDMQLSGRASCAQIAPPLHQLTTATRWSRWPPQSG